MALYYTTAPESYDGFGTVTVKAEIGRDRKGNPVRLVAVPKEARFGDWQILRYRSGLHLACSEAEWESISDLIVTQTSL